MWDEIDSYERVLELGFDGVKVDALWPWQFYPRDELIDVLSRWPSDGGSRLYASAKRVDCDDLASFEEGSSTIALIEGWTAGGRGFQYLESYPDAHRGCGLRGRTANRHPSNLGALRRVCNRYNRQSFRVSATSAFHP